MKNEILVSVICNTYNHEKYIRDAIESFLMQKTSFSYEVLIHDDASTDKTVSIIKEYELKYPNIIKPYYQKENQYSKGKRYADMYQYPRVKGKYIAICEGDDYWIDQNKLQKQFEAMEAHPEVDMCAHAAYRVKNDNIVGKIEPKKSDCIICTDEVILGGGDYFATNSLFYRTEMRKSIPKFTREYSLDYFLQIWGSLRGGILYLSDYMSCYRLFSLGSWTNRVLNNQEKRILHIKKVNNVLKILNAETGEKYAEAIETHINNNEIQILEIEKKYSDIRNNRLFKCLPMKRKIKIYLYCVLQKLGIYK